MKINIFFEVKLNDTQLVWNYKSQIQKILKNKKQKLSYFVIIAIRAVLSLLNTYIN